MKWGLDGEERPREDGSELEFFPRMTFLCTNIREKQGGTSESFVEHIPASRNYRRSGPQVLAIYLKGR